MIGYFDVRNGCAGDMIAGALAGCVGVMKSRKFSMVLIFLMDIALK